ncbi:hypothetical protein [Capsulimonas corticalis]|uniref:hypothetical protein n=1 Tax=Capsulimonas corticalis TaxID=2219043 RepID=UPI000E646866|nr:hypothetical protein [Capsulimonas corticalis]
MECPDCGYIMTAFDLDCARCQKYGKPAAKAAAPAVTPQDNHCSTCGLLNDAGTEICKQCNAPLTGSPLIVVHAPTALLVSPADPLEKTVSAWRPGAVKFNQATPQQIDEQATRSIREATKERSGGFTIVPIWIFWWAGLIGPFLVYVGGIWSILGIPLCGAFLWAIYEGIGKPLLGRVGSLDEKELAGERYRWRNMHIGLCPICNGSIVLIANEDRREMTCAHCRGPLLFEGGYVSPR